MSANDTNNISTSVDHSNADQQPPIDRDNDEFLVINLPDRTNDTIPHTNEIELDIIQYISFVLNLFFIIHILHSLGNPHGA